VIDNILFEGENISFDASLVMYINRTNIPPIMIINRGKAAGRGADHPPPASAEVKKE
jgi:hypothetical protein